MKKINIKRSVGALLASIVMMSAVSGCTSKFEEYNTHPYRPYEPDMSWLSNLMRQMVVAHENRSQHYEQMIGGDYGGYFAMSSLWDGTNFTTYNPSDSWIQTPFSDVMSNTYSEYFVGLDYTKGEGPVWALAKVLRVVVMSKLSDVYGPIPYSKVTPDAFVYSYDPQDKLYETFIQDLDDAILVMTSYVNATNDEESLDVYDVVYNNRFGQWVKFANSIKLRLAMRISNVNPTLARRAAEEAVSHQIGVITANSDNAFIKLNVENPYQKASATWNDLRANASIVSYMNGYSDPRRSSYFTQSSIAGYEYIGMRAGISYNTSQNASYLAMSMPAFPTTGQGSGMMVINAAEVAFLKAEAVLNGWTIAGSGLSVRELYEQGISLSMEQYGVAAAQISAYIADNALTPENYTDPVISSNSESGLSNVTIKWDDAAGNNEKLERLIIQKWIAMYPLGFEAWADYRRTGYPNFFKVKNNLSTGADRVDTERMARRVKFPPNEYQQNAANIQAAVQMLGGPDSPATDLWWAKKN